MLLAMARDVRVILIKLADRLHNMRTLDVMHPKKRARIARETLEIYAPIANRLGLNAAVPGAAGAGVPPPLSRTATRCCPRRCRGARGNRTRGGGQDPRRHQAAPRGQPASRRTVSGREKNLYSIYKKMQDKNLSFSEVFDIYGFRVIVKDTAACYLALGALHQLYKPIPGKFKDYIAIPKANGYQSLHTTLFGPFGTPIEIQIRTLEMHKIAEAGVASHWLYKRPTPDQRAAHARPTSGCRACWRCSRRAATRSSSSSTSRSICSRTRSTCSRPRARSWRCRMARPAWTSPTRCTPTSATAAWRQRSTTSWCRCAPS